MDNAIRIGVVGAGKMGTNHMRALSALNKRFEFVGAYDPIKDRSVVAEDYGGVAFDSYEELLQSVDAVTIPSPTSTHFEMAKEACEYGVHALVEKPISESKGEAEQLCSLFERNGLVLSVGFVERFNPAVAKLASILDGREIYAVDIRRCAPFDGRITDADVVTDLMVHDIDILVNAIIGEEPTSIKARGAFVYGKNTVDYAHALAQFENGAVASITASRCTSAKIREISIHTSGSLIECDMLRRIVTIKSIDGNGYETATTIPVVNKDSLSEEFVDFHNAIIGHSGPLIDGRQIVRTMSVLESIRSSIYQEAGK